MSGLESAFLVALGAGKMMTTLAQGQYARDAARAEARLLENKANATEALSQREAIERRREADLVRSRAIAVAGASGTGVDDPSTVKILEGIEDQGEYNFLAALYDGKVEANTLRYAGQMKRAEGQMARKASYITAIADMGTSLYEGGMFDPGTAATGSSELADWTMPDVDTDLSPAFAVNPRKANPYGLRI